MTIDSDRFSKAETMMVTAVEVGVSGLAKAREVVGTYLTMVRAMPPDSHEGLLSRASPGLLTPIFHDVSLARVAFLEGIAVPYPNGQGKGHIHKVEPIERKA